MNNQSPTTYQIGLVQAQAYRNLQLIFRDALAPYELTIPEWSVLGVVCDHNQIGLTQLTEILKSKASHPTVLVERLQQRGLLERTVQDEDKRAKFVRITPAGRAMVIEAEPRVRLSLGLALSSIDRRELDAYYATLLALAGLPVKT